MFPLSPELILTDNKEWNAIVSGLLITAFPLLLTMVLPINKIPKSILMVLVSFAVGNLLGDVFMHILPSQLGSTNNDVHSFHTAHVHGHHHEHGHNHGHSGGHHHGHSHGHSHGHADDQKGLWVLFGLLAFLVIDKLIHSFDDHDHSHSHSHDHSHEKPIKPRSKTRKSKQSDTEEETPQKSTLSKSLPILTLLANILHTITDGIQLAIVHTSSSPTIAISTTLAIFSHEVPHKLSDFAILANSGYSFSYCILMQVLMSMGTFIGIVGTLFWKSMFKWDESSVLLFSAGGLIYTATVGIIPSITNVGNGQFLLNLVAIGSGVYLCIH